MGRVKHWTAVRALVWLAVCSVSFRASATDNCAAQKARVAELQGQLTALETGAPTALKCEQAPEVCSNYNQKFDRWHKAHDTEVNQLEKEIQNGQCGTVLSPCDQIKAKIAQLEAEIVQLESSAPTALKCEQAPAICAQRQAKIDAWHKQHDPELSRLKASPQCGFDTCGTQRARLAELKSQLAQIGAGGPTALKCEQAPEICKARSAKVAQDLAKWHQQHDAEVSRLQQTLRSSICWRYPDGTQTFSSDQVSQTLTTAYVNPAVSSFGLCGGIFMEGLQPPFEWTAIPTPNDQVVGVTGIVFADKISGDDMPFSHPFGFDSEFFVAPDPQYESLLAPSNAGPDSEYSDAASRAYLSGLPVSHGVIGVEVERDLIPFSYRPPQFDRVAVFGRWIVDCGHDDFHSEIHPPLLIAKTMKLAPDETDAVVWGLPFLVGQTFEHGPLFLHLFTEAAGAATPGLPTNFQIKAQPRFEPQPFHNTQTMVFYLTPPVARASANDKLAVTYHFTVRPGVSVQVVNDAPENPGHAKVRVVMTKYNSPAPPLHDWTISPGDLSNYDNRAGDLVGGLIEYFASPVPIPALIPVPIPIPLPPPNVFTAAVLAGGILASLHSQSPLTDAPLAAVSPHDLEVNTVSTDENQMYPVYGWINVRWVRERQTKYIRLKRTH